MSTDGTTTLCVNGEIYNHKDLRADNSSYEFATGSDCEVHTYFTPSASIAVVDRHLSMLLYPRPSPLRTSTMLM